MQTYDKVILQSYDWTVPLCYMLRLSNRKNYDNAMKTIVAYLRSGAQEGKKTQHDTSRHVTSPVRLSPR